MMQAETYSKDYHHKTEKFRHKIKITCGLRDAYKDFKKKHKLKYPHITGTQYVNICQVINEGLANIIIKDSFELKMPGRMGTLSVKKSKMRIRVKDGKLDKRNLIIDWKKSWEYWHEQYPDKTRKEINEIKNKLAIYQMNDHTNGYVMRWKWDKSTCNLPNHTVYQFRPTKKNRLDLATWIKSDERTNDYYLDKHYGIRTIKELREREKKLSDVES